MNSFGLVWSTNTSFAARNAAQNIVYRPGQILGLHEAAQAVRTDSSQLSQSASR